MNKKVLHTLEFDKVIEKGHVDFGDIPTSKGNIENYKGYQNMVEILDVIAAIVVFILTEDRRLPMILIDRWTPLMVLLLLICWIADIRLMRYRDRIEN